MQPKLDSLPAPKFRYSPARAFGPYIQTAGMVGLDPSTGTLAGGGAGEEFGQILRNLDGFLADNALTRADVVAATVYVTDFAAFGAINHVWDAHFTDDEALPARTSVGVSALPIGAAVEADFLIARHETQRGEDDA